MLLATLLNTSLKRKFLLDFMSVLQFSSRVGKPGILSQLFHVSIYDTNIRGKLISSFRIICDMLDNKRNLEIQ